MSDDYRDGLTRALDYARRHADEWLARVRTLESLLPPVVEVTPAPAPTPFSLQLIRADQIDQACADEAATRKESRRAKARERDRQRRARKKAERALLDARNRGDGGGNA